MKNKTVLITDSYGGFGRCPVKVHAENSRNKKLRTS